MKFGEILPIIDGVLLTRYTDSTLDIICVAGCDLLSDVLTFARPESLLLTGLTNEQVIRTVEVADLAAVIFVRGKQPPLEVIVMAEEKGIPLATSPFTMFEICGRLYQAGLVSCDALARE